MGIINKLKSSLSSQQKDFLKKILPLGLNGRGKRAVKAVKWKLNNLGFTERGLMDLEKLYNEAKKATFKSYVAWELALWHANQQTKHDAMKALDYLKVYMLSNPNHEEVRRAIILTTECFVILGDIPSAKRTINNALNLYTHPDIYLSAANIEQDLEKRLNWINEVLKSAGLLELKLADNYIEKDTAYDALETVSLKTLAKNNVLLDNKVTVIMPVYNAEKDIHTSLPSVINQTWVNIEILVVDDASTDRTIEEVEKYKRVDSRVKLIKAKTNGGPYVARNLALKYATGDYITINDGDDWSHPEKIERQVLHLINTPEIVGNMSEQARMTNDLMFFRRGRPGEYIFGNFSSFMFRKNILDELGFWDSVRFAADSEFYVRVKKVFGETAVTELKTGPLSFQRQTGTSLTGNEVFGYPGFKMGARREYEMAHNYYHSKTTDLYYSFPQSKRPFAIPEPMWPLKEEKRDGFRVFDLIIAADFRQEDALVERDITILKSRKLTNRKIGFIQLNIYDCLPNEDIAPVYRDIVNAGIAEIAVYGEKIEAAHTIIYGNQCLEEYQKYIPEVVSSKAAVIIKKYSISKENTLPTNLGYSSDRVKDYFGVAPTWFEEISDLKQLRLEKDTRKKWSSIINYIESN
ncbi:glycosyltransferase family 2 protein [Salipaludibacillus agaradhaerens]|jgi:glycosyltransferase involved in cell wall biosynthesis|uniref:Glycosyltransferase family 2 protein n=1 Tax=Salipaludibacillus agaradhaerens TaxID=76935 RepID=A0A9Q4AY72_SALAG|nr:glycosyltransferase family A protein [Salipaludibacillus agaradhaerens]MCR6094934.1 glycosyltransferase family 2 protein [Salipaludibacillus agaradhaerens]MCR6115508.1 glycosyltransferase family 2 protein [Salipaludibacillus agaradhaerens]